MTHKDEETSALRKKRGYYKGVITKLKSTLTDEYLLNASIQMLQLREEKLLHIYSEYETICITLEEIEDANTETLYFQCLELIKGAISQKKKCENAQSHSKIKLPDVHLPTFEGNYMEYRPFIEMFRAMIDRDQSIEDIQKLFYLRSYLKGEALDLIKSLPVVGPSYKTSLEILNKRYDNEAKIVFVHISQLLDMKPVGKPSIQSLRALISEAKQHVEALKSLGQAVDKWDAIIVCILSRKLDQLNNRAFYLDRNSHSIPTFNEFIEFLEGRALGLEASGIRDGSEKEDIKRATPSKVSNVNVSTTNLSVKSICHFCGKSEHKIFNCPKFLLASAKERIEFAKTKQLCKTCLNPHKSKCKFHFKCQHCKQNHNSLLHNSEEDCEQNKDTVALHAGASSNQVLLPTAQVKVICKDGTELIVKALLDSASQSSFMTTSLAKKLGTLFLPNQTGVIGIANAEKTINYSVQTEIWSCNYPYKVNVNCLVVDKITTKLPQQQFDFKLINIPKNINLADNSFNSPSEIDMLLSADIFFQSLLPQPEELSKKCDPAHPRFVHTQFGYIVAGNLPEFPSRTAAVSLMCIDCNNELNNTMKQFWQAEKSPELFTEHTSEQSQCEEHFQNTVKLVNNKFEVSIPFKVSIYDINNYLGDSLGLALKRFLNLEKKFSNDSSLFKEYKKFIDEYLELGHATHVDISQYDLKKDPVYFLPHHAVLRPDAVSTKLRVVFDASMKTSNKISLNDLMLTGPVVQADIFDILLRFRLHEYFFLCDIRQMYRNIWLTKEQRSLQNILWRENPSESIKCLQLNTVTYGLRSSSYLATRCLQEIAILHKEKYPLGANALMQSSYVDDVLQSHDNLQIITEIKRQLIDLLALGGFNLHKWYANCSSILSDIPMEKQQCPGELGIRKDLKTLGLHFNTNTDSFCFAPLLEQPVNTKRQILSFISQFYDPLGLAGPIFVKAKELMQKLWLCKVNWDSHPPPALKKEWQEFYDSLTKMSPIHVKRNVCVKNQNYVELIGFSDASASAYGGAIYLRTTDEHGKVSMSLVCSKSRINPMNSNLSIPRLELNAALLLAKTMARVYDSLKDRLTINHVYLYSDSQVILAWLKTNPIKLNTYIANRVKMIQQLTQSFNWAYISTEQNPADCLSRGVKPCDLAQHPLWWSGPPCMLNSGYNFNNCSYDDVPKNIPELKPSPVASERGAVCAVSLSENNLLETLINKFSSINKAQRVLAFILRFCQNIKTKTNKVKYNFLTYSELDTALHLIIQHEQNKYYQNDISKLKANKQVKLLNNLNPFLDANGLLRVGGRLQHSALPYAQKHQIILPKDSTVTHLIIKNEHVRLLHASQKLLISSLNQKYWIIGGLRTIKKVIHKCLTCFRFKAATAQQLMGSLPKDRVNAHRPFEKVGMDFAGPIMIKQSRMRSVITTKGYIIVYVCFVVKAIHLELLSDLTTETFIASFKRFISRRNIPTDVYCDNAGTYKSANKQFQELYNLHNSKQHQAQVQGMAASMGIRFHFIPSYSPVFGGLWEAAVKSVKYHLKRMLGSHILTYEQMYTVLVQIEGVLNSRPLTAMSADVNDLSFLTPGHFLTGAPLNCIPEQDISNLPNNRMQFWQKCSALTQQFWKYWSKQYLNNLQNRPKWKQSLPNVKVGDLVILKETEAPPMTWPMARITQIFPGDDGKVRALEVEKANKKRHKTSITRICLLPLE